MEVERTLSPNKWETVHQLLEIATPIKCNHFFPLASTLGWLGDEGMPIICN